MMRNPGWAAAALVVTALAVPGRITIAVASATASTTVSAVAKAAPIVSLIRSVMCASSFQGLRHGGPGWFWASIYREYTETFGMITCL